MANGHCNVVVYRVLTWSVRIIEGQERARVWFTKIREVEKTLGQRSEQI